jgi:hypothetical protein
MLRPAFRATSSFLEAASNLHLGLRPVFWVQKWQISAIRPTFLPFFTHSVRSGISPMMESLYEKYEPELEKSWTSAKKLDVWQKSAVFETQKVGRATLIPGGGTLPPWRWLRSKELGYFPGIVASPQHSAPPRHRWQGSTAWGKGSVLGEGAPHHERSPPP